MDEEALIALMTRATASPLPAGAVGPGDDAAVLPFGDEDLVVTTDAVAEAVHFPAVAEPRHIGRFVANVNLSDLAAMGASPRGFLAAYAAPRDTPAGWFEGVASGIQDALGAFACPVLGGDTKEASSRVITGTALGAVPRAEAVLRTGAIDGDVLVVTGRLGGPAAVLHAWRAGEMDEVDAARGLLAVQARVTAGIAFREAGAHALIDTSDGLGRAAALMAAASRVRLEIGAQGLPLDPRVGDLIGSEPDAETWRDVVVGTGGDYELLAALPPALVGALVEQLGTLGVSLTPIGRCVEGEGAFLLASDGAHDLAAAGWRHFRGHKP